jgi:hypothetical protein
MSAPPLTYADLLSRWGVSIVQSERGLRVIVPPVSSWQKLHKGCFVGSAVLASITTLASFASKHDPGAFAAAAIYGAGLMIVIGAALHRLYRRLIFDITAQSLSLTCVTPLLSRTQRCWERSHVREIKHNPLSGKLLIRADGHDLFEIHVNPHAALVEWLGQALTAALSSTPPTDAESSLLSYGFAPPSKRPLFWTAGAMVAAALVTFIFGFPWAAFGIYLLLFSCVPIGIAFDTQEKEYYFL